MITIIIHSASLIASTVFHSLILYIKSIAYPTISMLFAKIEIALPIPEKGNIIEITVPNYTYFH